MFSPTRMKYSASLLIIVIVLINFVSPEPRRVSGGYRSSGGRSSGGRRPSGGVSKPPVHFPKPPVHVPKPFPVYHPPRPHTPSVPHTPHTSGPTSGKDSSNILIHSEGGGRPRPGGPLNDQKQQSSPHQPSAPVHDSATRVTVGNQNQANPHGTNTGSAYPPWANPSANPHAPFPSNPHPSQPHGVPYPNPGKPPGPMTSAPYPPTHPPGPISHQPINPSHQSPQNSGAPHGMPMPHQPPYPNSPHGMPPPYQPSPPYPGGHPQGMPMPNAPHIGFGNGGHSGSSHQPIGNPHHYPPVGNSPVQPHAGGIPQPTVINNHYHSPAPPIGSPQNPAGHPMYVHQPVYGGAPMGQPFVPGQTVVVLPHQQAQSSGPGLGQIFKEALVFSTVNAGVNRLINGAPHHHHDSYQPPPSATPGGTPSTSTVTNTVIYNQYGNPVPGPNATPMQGVQQPAQPGVAPGSPPTFPAGQPIGNTNVPAGSGGFNPAVVNPGIGTPSSGIPASGSQYPSPVATGTSNTPQGSNFTAGNSQQTGSAQRNAVASNTASNQTAAYPVQEFQYFISNDELGNLTESLFAKDELHASEYITLNLQMRSLDPNASDQANEPLLYVKKDAYNVPTIQALRNLFDNYEFDSEKKEFMDLDKRKEENVMLDVFLNTDIMTTAMQWLADKGYVEPDDFEWKDTLRHVWMSKVNGATSGFERIFLAEKYAGPSILGGQNWVYFDYQESLKHINYLSYVDKVNLGDKASMVKVNLKIDDAAKPNTTMLVGTPPELEMALYTICYYARPNDLCSVSLGGVRFSVYTHAFRYFGKDLIDLGLIFF